MTGSTPSPRARFWICRHRAAEVLDISPDGERFLMAIDNGEDPPPTELHVTRNWFEELNRVAPPTR